MLPRLTAAQDGQLGAFEELLAERAIQLGLVAESDASRLGERHVRDCLRVAAVLESGVVCDIGSGAGLPGMILAVARPDIHVVLLEPRTRAVAFLELSVDRLGLGNAEVRQARVEDLDLEADAATARAFGSLEDSWAAATRLIRPGGRLVYFAGESLEDPEAAARAISAPEPAASVLVDPVVAGSSPLVIMSRHA